MKKKQKIIKSAIESETKSINELCSQSTKAVKSVMESTTVKDMLAAFAQVSKQFKAINNRSSKLLGEDTIDPSDNSPHVAQYADAQRLLMIESDQTSNYQGVGGLFGKCEGSTMTDLVNQPPQHPLKGQFLKLTVYSDSVTASSHGD